MNASLGNLLLVLAVYTLAAARVVRLINSDVIADGVRLWIATRAATAEQAAAEAATVGHGTTAQMHERRMARWNVLQSFLACPWCVSIWVCAATVWLPLFHADNRVVQYVGVVLAVSHLIGVAAPLAADEDIEIVQS
jgi:hypothetical protein